MSLISRRSDRTRVIVCIDFDYFYAQCEEIRNPSLRGRPIVVCVFSGRTGDSGVVSTSNYIARNYGVKSGIPIKVARSKLADRGDAIFLPMDIKFYAAKSEEAMSVIRGFGDKYEYVGLDECFIDVTDSTNADFEQAKQLSMTIKSSVFQKTGLTCSLGVAPNKLVAKIASDFQKPDGLTVVPRQEVENFLSRLRVDKIPGVGPKTTKKLFAMGMETFGQLSCCDPFRLVEEFGRTSGICLYNASKGIDNELVTESGQTQQIGKIITLKKDASRSTEMYDDLQRLCRLVVDLATERQVAFKTIGVLLILHDLENITRSKTLKVHCTNYNELYSVAKSILDEAMDWSTDDAVSAKLRVRRLGVKLTDLKNNSGQNTISDFIGST